MWIPIPGETWTRESDLPDGECTYETFQKIINAILRSEFLEMVDLG